MSKTNQSIVKEEKTKTPKTTDPKKKFSYRFKKWFFGIGKEFGRITWPTKSRVIRDIFIAVFIVAILALIFLGIDQISGLVK